LIKFMKEGSIDFRSSSFHYWWQGSGSHILFAFHGYGESAASLAFLQDALDKDLTIVAVDLPFHGETGWCEAGLLLEPHDLLRLLEEIAASLPGCGGSWSLLGYSMGGRIALQLLQLAPDRVGRMVLVAPDGLKVNPWYRLAAHTDYGNRLFRRTMQRPAWFFFFLRIAHRLGLVNPSFYKFTFQYVADDQARQALYQRWTVLRGFKPSFQKVAAIVREKALPVHLIYGDYDRVIRWERGERFLRLAGDSCKLTRLAAGHRLLQPEFTGIIVSTLYLPSI
jgi:pimeloyl-ACP methyl ester carboxylesterase